MFSEYKTKPQFIVFVDGPEREHWMQENDGCEGMYHININMQENDNLSTF
jgi:hypothetical protein